MLLSEKKGNLLYMLMKSIQILSFISFKLIVFGIESMVIMQLMNDPQHDLLTKCIFQLSFIVNSLFFFYLQSALFLVSMN